MTAFGLSRVPTPMLELLVGAVERGRLECPFTASDLAAVGFRGHLDDVLAALAGVDSTGVLATLRVALAERAHRPPPRLDLVWTGPETRASLAQSTALVVERLFAEAQHSVIIGGYAFDTPEILEPLFRAMRDRAVSAMFFVDIDGVAQNAAGADAYATGAIDRFFRDVWTFGLPKPDIYFDPRTATPGPPWASLHAKCVVVDDEKSFITSANFTDRGQTRNIETGVLIEDAAFGEQLAGQWRTLVAEGVVRRYRG